VNEQARESASAAERRIADAVRALPPLRPAGRPGLSSFREARQAVENRTAENLAHEALALRAVFARLVRFRAPLTVEARVRERLGMSPAARRGLRVRLGSMAAAAVLLLSFALTLGERGERPVATVALTPGPFADVELRWARPEDAAISAARGEQRLLFADPSGGKR